MKRSYECWALACSDKENAGFMAVHADDGSRRKSPLLFRNKARALRWARRNAHKSIDAFDVHVEPVQVSVTVTLKS